MGRAHPENATRVYESLLKFGAPTGHFKEHDFAIEGTIVQLGVAPRRINIITAIDGVTFKEASADRLEANIDGVAFPVPSLNDRITNERATGRKKDALDAEWLEAEGE